MRLAMGTKEVLDAEGLVRTYVSPGRRGLRYAYPYYDGRWYNGYRYDNGYFYDRRGYRAYDRDGWNRHYSRGGYRHHR